MGKHNSTRVDEGRKSSNLFAKKNARHEPWWAGGKKNLLCDPGSELRLGGREKRRAKIINGKRKKKKKKERQQQRNGAALLHTIPLGKAIF